MENAKKEIYIHYFFKFWVILKGLNGVLEIFAGISLLFFGKITAIVTALIQGELVEDPNDFFANFFKNLLPTISHNAVLWGAFYLLAHGVIKIFLAVSLLRNKLWAYPASMIFLGLFIVYEFYKFASTGSIGFAALTIFDIVLLALVLHEI